MVFKFYWIPANKENEEKFLEQMKKPFSSDIAEGLREYLLKKSNQIREDLRPLVFKAVQATYFTKLKGYYSDPVKVSEKKWYCQLHIEPPMLEEFAEIIAFNIPGRNFMLDGDKIEPVEPKKALDRKEADLIHSINRQRGRVQFGNGKQKWETTRN